MKKAMVVLGTSAMAVSVASAFAAAPSRHLAIATRMQAAVTSLSPQAIRAAPDTPRKQASAPMVEPDGSAREGGPAPGKRTRRVMHCGVCGLPKKGHICRGPPPMSAAPIRGSVRMHHGFDRRLRQPLPEKPKPTLLLEEEAPAAPPQADARDALEDPMVQMCKFLHALPHKHRRAAVDLLLVQRTL